MRGGAQVEPEGEGFECTAHGFTFSHTLSVVLHPVKRKKLHFTHHAYDKSSVAAHLYFIFFSTYDLLLMRS